MVHVYYTRIQVEKKNHRKQSEWAHRLLDMALSREYPQISAPVLLEQDTYGKPFLVEYPQIHINISHSGCYAACAVGEKAVGVDIEVWKNRAVHGRIVEKFHPLEREQLFGGQPMERDALFYDLWVLKESFIKAEGRGLRIPLDSFCVQIKEKNVGRVEQQIRQEDFFYRLYRPDGGACSLAVCSADPEIFGEPVFLTVPEEP